MRTKLVEWPVVLKTPLRAVVLYTGQLYECSTVGKCCTQRYTNFLLPLGQCRIECALKWSNLTLQRCCGGVVKVVLVVGTKLTTTLTSTTTQYKKT